MTISAALKALVLFVCTAAGGAGAAALPSFIYWSVAGCWPMNSSNENERIKNENNKNENCEEEPKK